MLRLVIIPLLVNIPLLANLIYLFYKGIKYKNMVDIIIGTVGFSAAAILNILYIWAVTQI